MARKDATKAPPLDKYRKDIGKHDKRKGDKINKAEKRQREADAALESAVHKWPLLILGVISVCCGLLYLGLYFWLTVPENADLMEALSTGFARSTGFAGAEGGAEGSSKGDALNDDFASAQTPPV